MSLAETIRCRRSVQVYEDRPVPVELVQELLDTAVWAPNHRMTQPWRFILVHGDARRRIAEARRAFSEAEAAFAPERRQQRGEVAFNATMAVPAILVIVMREDPRPVTRAEDLVATSCVMQNFLLLAAERGLGVAVKTYAAMYHPPFREALGIGPGEAVVACLQLGYPVRVPGPQPRVPSTQRLVVLESAGEA